MLGERLDSRPTLRLVAVAKGTWLRPDVQTPDEPAAGLPAPYWASGPRRRGLRRSTVRVTCREAFARRPRRSEAYLPPAVFCEPTAGARPRSVAEVAPAPAAERERGPLLRLVADVMAQVFRPTDKAS